MSPSGAARPTRSGSTIPAVSRNHAVLHVGAGLKIQDLGSANGTVVRSKGGAVAPGGDTMNVRQLFQREAMFAVGDSLLFGTTCVVVRHRPAAGAAGPTAAKPGAIVRDPAMRQLYEQVTLVARATISVLILGETGAGQGGAGRARSTRSRAGRGAVPGINCATLTESLQESELFGFEKGAFTGAHQARAGLFESAQGGTVFLDEVGELSAGAQAKLLRVLEQRTVDAARIDARASRRRPLRRRDQPRHRDRYRGGTVSQRSVLSPQRGLAAHPAVARASRRDRAAGAIVPGPPPRSRSSGTSRRRYRRRRSRSCAPTAGPGTCASCATRSSAP
jgi:pSer/pThr/pTyr-binding forkhead associated (FHA) protein